MVFSISIVQQKNGSQTAAVYLIKFYLRQTINRDQKLGSFDLFCLGFSSFIVGRSFAVIGFLDFVVGLCHIGSKTG